MQTAAVIVGLRRRRALSLRRLARRGGTSHATIAAYESGRVAPTVDTLERLVRAAGCDLEPSLVTRLADADQRGDELEAVLDLAEQFPARHRSQLQAPVFGR
ncbi:MAG TPA: helix-turn-helix transcriptional regulator, partial [Ilumatobacteraceae bacterium]|nr:helix-turn-helix transcriptional regulator [Ilumatobacteraceae bacterium]